MQRMPVDFFIEPIVAANEYVKFQIVIWLVAVLRPQDAALAATIAAAEQQSFELLRQNNFFDAVQGFLSQAHQLQLPFAAAIERKRFFSGPYYRNRFGGG